MVGVVFVQPALLERFTLPTGFTGETGFPVGNVGEGVLDASGTQLLTGSSPFKTIRTSKARL